MKERKYLAYAGNGNDYDDFEFWSSSRKGSSKNLEDCKREYFKTYGYRSNISFTVVGIQKEY